MITSDIIPFFLSRSTFSTSSCNNCVRTAFNSTFRYAISASSDDLGVPFVFAFLFLDFARLETKIAASLLSELVVVDRVEDTTEETTGPDEVTVVMKDTKLAVLECNEEVVNDGDDESTADCSGLGVNTKELVMGMSTCGITELEEHSRLGWGADLCLLGLGGEKIKS